MRRVGKIEMFWLFKPVKDLGIWGETAVQKDIQRTVPNTCHVPRRSLRSMPSPVPTPYGRPAKDVEPMPPLNYDTVIQVVLDYVD